jgi:NAD(P)-dependent dehydrogenase (short-subunit alcohol dehydrogenase family)
MKTVVITGTSRGIGKATAQKFLDQGWEVIGTSTSGKTPVIHDNLKMHQLDLADSESILRFIGGITGRKTTINVLINNAGIGLPADREHISVDVLRQTLEINLIGLIALTESLLPLMLNNGHIINVSSALASLTEDMGTWSPAYRISKAGVNMYTRHLANVLRSRRVTVSSFDPGWVRTDMGSMNAPRDPSESAEELFQLATASVDSGYFWRGGKKRAW